MVWGEKIVIESLGHKVIGKWHEEIGKWKLVICAVLQ
jgi:hypothetical protein